jgi:hypothetical protein
LHSVADAQLCEIHTRSGAQAGLSHAHRRVRGLTGETDGVENPSDQRSLA